MERRRRILAYAISVASVCYLVVSTLSFGLDRGLYVDEHQYLAPCVLVSQGQVPYADFAYAQTPLMPLAYGAFFLLAPAGFTAARVLTVVLGAATAALMACALYRRVRALGLAAATLATAFFCWSLAGHPLFPLSTSYIHNQTLALFLCVAGFLVLPESLDPAVTRRAGWRVFAGALLVGLACSTRVIFAPVGPLVVLWALVAAPRGKRVRPALAALAGIVAGLAPTLVCFLAAPTNFVWNVFLSHADRPGLEHLSPLASIGGLARVWRTAREFADKDYLAPTNLLFLVCVVAAVATLVRRRATSWLTSRDVLAILVAGVLAAATSAIPLHLPHYFATAVVFEIWVIAVFLGWSVARLRDRKGVELLVLLPLVALCVAYASWIVRFHAQRGVFRTAGVAEVRADAVRLREALGENADILTPSPCVVIEAGCPCDPRMSYGILGYRWARRIPPERARALHLLTPAQAEADFAARRPDGAIVSLGNVDALFETAIVPHYRKTAVLRTGVLYVRPDLVGPVRARGDHDP